MKIIYFSKTLNFAVAILYIILINLTTSRECLAQKIVNVSETGIDSLDATLGILNAVELAKKQGATKIIIPKGRYHFYPLKAFEKYVAIGNNDNGLKRIAFPIIDFQNLEIDGQGSNFIFHGAMVPILIEKSTNISLKNFSIDWKRPVHSEGTVVVVDEKNKTFDLKMDEEFPYAIRGNELIYLGDNGYEQGLQENVFFDPKTRGIVYDNSHYWMDPWMKRLDYEYTAKEISPGVVRILDTIGEALPKIGWVFVTKGNKMLNRISPAIHLLYSTDINLASINIYHAGSMGLIAEKSKNISLNKFNVTIAPGSKRLLSSAADATHFIACKGEINIIDCLFENMHDDGTNIHGAYTLLVNTIDKNTVAIKLNHVQQFGHNFASKGDSIMLLDRATLYPYAKLIVSDVKKINEEYSYLIFNENITDIVKPNTALENLSWYPEKVLINGCTVRNNRARGLLISTPGKVEITNNYFSNEMAAISIGGDANFWWESGPVNNVTISNNKFYNCCISKLDQAVIMINPNILKPEQSKAYFEKNIVIDNNTFETFDTHILRATSTDGLKFTNNKILQTKLYTPFYPNDPAIKVNYSRNITIQNNQYLGEKPAAISLDNSSAAKSIIKDNKGFEKSGKK